MNMLAKAFPYPHSRRAKIINTDPASSAFVVGFLLALGYHRHRAAQIGGLLALLALGAGAGSLHLREAALRLAPWLILGCALMPEPRLLSKRHGGLLITVGGLLLVALHAPPGLLAMPVKLAALPLFGLDPGRGATALLFLAGTVCALRFLQKFQPFEAGLSASVFLAAAGCGRAQEMPAWLLTSALVLLASVLYASYRMAFIDPLTGLPNRRALDETLSRLSGDYSLAMIDIDHFKVFNDTHGHDAGDVVLQRVASRLRSLSGGSLYRYGGEEFCAVYRGVDAAAANTRLDAARAGIEALRIALPSKRKAGSKSATSARLLNVEVTISAGVASRTGKRRETSEVLKAADQALYQAKAKGRNRVECSV
ncbi:MAG: diguanylate cyclase [Pseudomarimonas sp.]